MTVEFNEEFKYEIYTREDLGMDNEKKRYGGYQEYNKKKSDKNLESSTKMFLTENRTRENENTLPVPVMNVESLFKLADFLETSKTNSSFPEITVIPDVLKNVGKFVNERKKMKYSHRKFEMKINFLSDGVDKQYRIAMQKIQNETEICDIGV